MGFNSGFKGLNQMAAFVLYSFLLVFLWACISVDCLAFDYGRSPLTYVNQRLQIQLGLLMMSGIPLETCWAFNVLWNNKFRYQVPSCWLLLLSYGWFCSEIYIALIYWAVVLYLSAVFIMCHFLSVFFFWFFLICILK